MLNRAWTAYIKAQPIPENLSKKGKRLTIDYKKELIEHGRNWTLPLLMHSLLQ